MLASAARRTLLSGLPSAARAGISTSRAVLAADDGSGEASQLKLNFVLPHQAVYSGADVDMVIIPGESGEYGVTAGHVPVVAQLRPGVVQIFHKADDEPEQFFVAGGFAFTHPDSTTDITAIDAAKLEDLDEAAVRAGLDSYKAKMDAAEEGSQEAAYAEIGFDVHTAMAQALGIAS
eukprot:PLAT7189.1.p2 GENE.PLAT7189.1~~PLAT7189.1.p2  ORF type:complete len:177 (-),score=77.03 PLAT7189.1:199-729(-)